MKKLLVLMIPLLILLTGCFKTTDGEKFKEEYESLNGTTSVSDKGYLEVDVDKNNVMKYTSIDKIIDIIKNGTGVIYLGYPECPWCRNAVSALLEASDSTSIDTIYYLNMKDVRDRLTLDSDGNIITEKEGVKGYDELLAALDSILDDYTLTKEDGTTVTADEKRVYVPLVVFVKNGKIVDYHIDTVESQRDPYVALTKEEKNELINIYKEGILKVTGDSSCNEKEKGKC